MRNNSLIVFFLLCVLSGGTGLSLENSTFLYREGARLAMSGDIDGAIVTFKKVIEVSPYYSLGHYGLGKAYLFKYGMLDDAIKHLRLSVELDRKFSRGFFYLGLAYFFNKKYVRAIHAFKECYDADDTYIEALYNLGSVYDIIGRDFEANYYFRKYFNERDKEDKDVLF